MSATEIRIANIRYDLQVLESPMAGYFRGKLTKIAKPKNRLTYGEKVELRKELLEELANLTSP